MARQRKPSKKALAASQLSLSSQTSWTMDWSYRGATFEQDTLERVRELLNEDRGSDSGLKKAEYVKLAQWLTDCLYEKGAPDEWEVAWKQVKSKLTSICYPCPCLIIF